jgi:4'-phosphopantetheinyl transferase EntD
VPILRGPTREPLWPPGVVGSITHCRGYRAAAVARQSDIWTIGIDAEPHEALPSGVAESVLIDSETAWLAAAPPGFHWDRVFFSAKESVYKAWFPLMQRWLGFEEAAVTFDPTAFTFEARILVPAPVPVFRGRYAVHEQLVLTAIALRRP